MRRLYRLISWLIVAVGIAFIGLGLLNTHRGLPAGSLTALRTIPAELRAQSRRWLQQSSARDAATDEQPADGLQIYRQAIGCDTPQNRADDPGTLSASYRWRDANGVVNFSDTPPQDSSARRELLVSGHKEFFVSVRAEDAVLPSTLEGSISAGAKRSYEQWRDWLGDAALVRSHINIRFIGDGERFYRIYGKAPGDAWTATGFYRIQTNEALVLYTSPYRENALKTAFHEMSHLITAWHLGLTPPWLNEGIAEHFETMRVSWQGAEFADNAGHRALLRDEGPLPLATLLALSPRDWREQGPARQYASAWALIAFLLDSEAGRDTLQQLIRRAHAQRCAAPTDLAGMLDNYPGGRQTLEADWQRWIGRDRAQTGMSSG
jgi:hypothetical protein